METAADWQVERGQRLLKVVALRRTAEPAAQAGRAVNRLAMSVAEWRSKACLDITLAMERRGVGLFLAQYGTAQPGWDEDVRWALGEVAELRRRSHRPTAAPTWSWESVCEIVAKRSVRARLTDLPGREVFVGEDLTPDHPTEPSLTSGVWLEHPLRLATSWPEPAADDMATIVSLLAAEPNLRLRYRLAPADSFELDVLGEAFSRTFANSPERMHRYFGTPLRVRALIASVRGPVPARARAVLCRGATGLAVRHLSATEARTAWEGGPDSLVGHAQPEGFMHALVRLPAAGDSPFPGFSTTSKLIDHPLDPVPAKPADPIRLGYAWTSGGGKVDVHVGAGDLLRHTFIEGTSGAGKSTLIAALVREFVRLGYGCVFQDPHGTTVNAILSELPAENHHSVRVIRVGDEDHPIPLNVYNSAPGQMERVISEVAETVQSMYDPKREGIVGPRWTRWFSLIAEAAAIALGNHWSLLAVYEIGRDTQRVNLLAQSIRLVRPELAKSLLDEIVADRSNEAASFLAWASSKLQPLVATMHIRGVLGTGADAIDIPAAADEGRVLLIDLASTTIGDPAARMYGGLVLLKAAMAMGTRRRMDKPFFVIVDEAHLFEFGGLPKLLSEGRKHGIGVVVATQHMGQLREDLATGLETNTGTLLTLRTGVRHAERSSLRLAGWPVGEIVRLPNLTAAATVSHEGTMTEPFTLHIDHHQRMARANARGSQARARGELTEERSLREMWAPHAHLEPVTAAKADWLLRAGIRPAEASDTAAPPATSPEGGQFDAGRLLDDLAAQQARRQPADPSPSGTAISTASEN